MDTGSTVKPISAVQAHFARPEPLPLRTAVATELAAARSVTAASDTIDTTGYDPARNPYALPPTTEQVVVKPQTRDVVSRVISTRSGEILSQIPGETMLKMRAYFRAELASSEPDAHLIEKSA